jgi:hypothetical protein
VAPITPAEKARLTTVFEMFGPERVARGLCTTGHGWDDCFLARATVGDLEGFAPGLRRHCRMQRLAALEPGLERAVAALWDRDEEAFRALANEWLEHHPVSRGQGLAALRRPSPEHRPHRPRALDRAA